MLLSSLTATEVAFLQVATVQGVAAVVWGLGAWYVPGERRAIAHWSAVMRGATGSASPLKAA